MTIVTKEPWRLRPADAADAEAVADVYLRARRSAHPEVPLPAHGDDDVRNWIATVLIPGGEVRLAEAEEQRIVGMMALRQGWIDQLYLDPDWTGRGLGSDFVALAKSLYPTGLDLWTFVTNERAHAFYERLGFIAIQMTDGRENENRAPDVRYRWHGAGTRP
jgi:GNAT superfamily N-acetyltransferase